MLEVNLASINCRGLSELKKRRDVMQFMRNQEHDVLFLQDTHLTKESCKYFNCLWKGKSYHSCHSNRSRGVSILIKHSLQHDLIKVQHADCGNFIIVVCKIGTQTYLFANIYGPNDDDPIFYQNLASILESFQTNHTIIGGDFNFVINPSIDSLNYAREYNTSAKQVFFNFINNADLVDIWRIRNPNKLEYTWSRNNPLKSGRLDMFFVNTHLISSIPDVLIKPGYRTDHNFVIMKMHVKEMEKGSGIWKMNESILKNADYVEHINTTIKNTVCQYAIPVYDYEYLRDVSNYEHVQLTINDGLFYETLLMLIRGDTVQYCKRKAHKRRAKEKVLIKKVQDAQNVLNHDKSDANAQSLDKVKEELENLRKPYIEGLIVRSRAQWHEEGEKSSKYFLSLEKRNATRKSIQYIENEGQTITKSNEILSLFTKTLQDKYSVPEEIAPDKIYIRNNLAETLTEHEKSDLEVDISLQELTVALQNMKKGRTPGSNGFSADFFRYFWKFLGSFLLRAFRFCVSEGKTLITHRESIITLIPKTGRTNHSLKNWRPISLLNVDYKIISTAIANRFKKVINRIISSSQSAYIKGRYIGENSRLVYDTISHINQTNKSGLIMAADFEAAFETVSWPYVRAVLEEMNFGEKFIDLINMMYLNQHNFSRILLNGFLGEKIYMQRGIRQGDPVSGYLFNIAVEILAKQMNESSKLTGINISANTEIRISQYADDTILFLDGSERSLNGVIEELTAFSKQSGLNLNWEKTVCLPLGTLNPPDELDNNVIAKFKWVK